MIFQRLYENKQEKRKSQNHGTVANPPSKTVWGVI
jgi:hypothetical protein